MIEISSEVLVVGTTRARSYNTIMYKAVHMTYEVSRTSIAKGSLRHNETTVKRTMDRRTTRRRTPISYHASVGKKKKLELLEFPPINSWNFLVMQSGVGDTGEAIYISPKTNNSYIQAVSIRQHITKKTSEIVYLNLRKASVIRAMAILPNSPILGGVEVILPLAA